VCCSTNSTDEFATTRPVSPIVNRKYESSCNKQVVLYVVWDPYVVASNLKILIPVGTALIIVADVKYPRVSLPIPTVNIW